VRTYLSRPGTECGRQGSPFKRGYWDWLEGYLLTGRHGVFSCYEAFIHIVDSMFNQHAGQESL
jgi:hypothetical protein